MFGNTLKSLMIGGKVVALGTLLGTTAMAQTSTDTVIVPEAAMERDTAIGTIGDSAPRSMEQMDNDQMIAETLIAQGFGDVYILREGPILTVTANRDGEEIELVYSVANGRLMSINGYEVGDDGEVETAGDRDTGVAASAAEMDPDADGDVGEGADGDGSDDGAGDDAGGTEGDTGDGAGDDAGGDAGSDTGGDTGGDAGGDAGSDTGGDTGSDAGSDAGGDSGGDAGGESDGGSTNG
ncbi:hypothetical protein MLD63_10020 [Paracoccus sp. TK19116]|uniref:PepSY domain-containing protein n=1 Tax=Paracoccus albicereus TaxID=2922394 RepID=A0ABT1MR20_9RHOB|nr:hypothetical protein [Paracoccus albicereus]MCQ0970760.1 hypothetical protein [Paracoccus albicereus]